MAEWWNGLTGLQQIFYGVGTLFSLILILQTVLMLFGIDHNVPHGADIAHGDGSGADAAGIHVLSIRTIVAFFVGFGWGGAAASGLGAVPSILVAAVTGTAFMLGVFWLMKCLFSLRYSGTLDYGTAVGQVGSVYMAIPAEQAGNGQVEVMIQGRLQVLPACTKAKEKIPSRTKVRVVGTADPQTLLVEAATEKEGEK